MATSRKRSREIPEENRAECVFTISYTTGSSASNQPKNKKRKGQDDEKKGNVQLCPFSPTGKFKSISDLDLYYVVNPRKDWSDMTRYNSFVLNQIKYFSEGFVYVANESTIEQEQNKSHPGGAAPAKKKDTDWVARILEIRAADEHHVYARIYWMYSPDELPAGTIDGRKTIQGRQPYHGANELIASNHMDVINVVSVTGGAKVSQWIETEDEEIQDAHYWRQAYDYRSGQLSSVETMCVCETPANPDKTLLGCPSDKCGKWMHEACVEHDILMKVYNELGTDKPHTPQDPAEKAREAERATRPLSPTDLGENPTQATIDVQQTPRGYALAQQSPASSASKLTASKKGRKKKGPEAKPYEGLFEAKLIMSEEPTYCEIRDLRDNIFVGEKEWKETASCLFCQTPID